MSYNLSCLVFMRVSLFGRQKRAQLNVLWMFMLEKEKLEKAEEGKVTLWRLMGSREQNIWIGRFLLFCCVSADLCCWLTISTAGFSDGTVGYWFVEKIPTFTILKVSKYVNDILAILIKEFEMQVNMATIALLFCGNKAIER